MWLWHLANLPHYPHLIFSYELIAHDGARADRNEAHGAQGNCPTTHLPHPTCYMIFLMCCICQLKHGDANCNVSMHACLECPTACATCMHYFCFLLHRTLPSNNIPKLSRCQGPSLSTLYSAPVRLWLPHRASIAVHVEGPCISPISITIS